MALIHVNLLGLIIGIISVWLMVWSMKTKIYSGRQPDLWGLIVIEITAANTLYNLVSLILRLTGVWP